jgi:hypothetical protein
MTKVAIIEGKIRELIVWGNARGDLPAVHVYDRAREGWSENSRNEIPEECSKTEVSPESDWCGKSKVENIYREAKQPRTRA